MAAISNSLLNPAKIFEIIISSNEFPNVKKEFIKLMNQINVQGYSIVNALRAIAYNTPSKKMSELLSGLAATINSGGDLTKFFETRAETLLFDYKIKRENETKTAETFMDLYISIVIASANDFHAFINDYENKRIRDINPHIDYLINDGCGNYYN